MENFATIYPRTAWRHRTNLAGVRVPNKNDATPIQLFGGGEKRVKVVCDLPGDAGTIWLNNDGNFVTDNASLASQAHVVTAVTKFASSKKGADFFSKGCFQAILEWDRAIRDALKFPDRQILDIQPIGYGELFLVRTEPGKDNGEVHGYIREKAEGEDQSWLYLRVVRNIGNSAVLIAEIIFKYDGKFNLTVPRGQTFNRKEQAALLRDYYLVISEIFYDFTPTMLAYGTTLGISETDLEPKEKSKASENEPPAAKKHRYADDGTTGETG